MNTPTLRMAFMALQALSSTYMPPNTVSPLAGMIHIAIVARPNRTVDTGVSSFLPFSPENVSRRNTMKNSPRIMSSGSIAPNCE